MDNSNGFGTYLKLLRKAKGLTFLDIMGSCGVSQPYLSQLENGKCIPSPDIVRKLSTALNCTHIGLMIKAGHITDQEVYGHIHQKENEFQLVVGESFGDYFRRLRRSKGFKEQKQLAEASGVSQATISRIEDGTQYPSDRTFMDLAYALSHSFEDLKRIAGGSNGSS
jgi:transcriptional regulator with XRE-family HTH domain